ncbi:hypothetical protein MMC25_000423 [Agyrium rufum]|nr:hypothetical protein [Agyrium rufum]
MPDDEEKLQQEQHQPQSASEPSAPSTEPNAFQYQKSTSSTKPSQQSPASSRITILKLPAPIKRFFDVFPLYTLPPSPLPVSASRTDPVHHRSRNALYVFTTPRASVTNAPSFNPSCLKWQTYLKFRGVDFITVLSSNHASPTGALPCLVLPSKETIERHAVPLGAGEKLRRWAVKEGGKNGKQDGKEDGDDGERNMRYEAYASLVESKIRAAWLYAMYLTPSNFESVTVPLYINPTTSSSLLRTYLAHNLRNAAYSSITQILHTSSISTSYTSSLLFSPIHPASTTANISGEAILAGAREAFEALATLLGDDEWFFGADRPGLLDASVFAYACLALDEDLGMEEGGKGWRDQRLRDIIRDVGNGVFVSFVNRIKERYYS